MRTKKKEIKNLQQKDLTQITQDQGRIHQLQFLFFEKEQGVLNYWEKALCWNHTQLLMVLFFVI